MRIKLILIRASQNRNFSSPLFGIINALPIDIKSKHAKKKSPEHPPRRNLETCEMQDTKNEQFLLVVYKQKHSPSGL